MSNLSSDILIAFIELSENLLLTHNENIAFKYIERFDWIFHATNKIFICLKTIIGNCYCDNELL